MSKLYEKYLVLKQNESNKLYLFKSGIFYLFLDADAQKVSSLLNLKLTNLNDNVVKCSFPVKNLSQYLHKFNLLGLDVSVIDSVQEKPCPSKSYVSNLEIINFIKDLSTIDSNKLSIREAYSLIDNIQEKAQKFVKEI